MKIYVASSWRNNHQPTVVSMLRELGHSVYDFKHPEPGHDGFHWSEIDGGWQDWDVNRYRTALDHPIALRGYGKDMAAMEAAHGCVVVMPCGRSAHLEAGWFCGRGRPCWFYYPATVMVEPELMAKMGSGGIIDGPVELRKLFWEMK